MFEAGGQAQVLVLDPEDPAGMERAALEAFGLGLVFVHGWGKLGTVGRAGDPRSNCIVGVVGYRWRRHLPVRPPRGCAVLP